MKCAQLYKGKCEEVGIEFTRVWSMPTPWTFSMRPVQALLEKYVENPTNWIDPYAGKNSPDGIRNDHNPEAEAEYHLDALDFLTQLPGEYDGILYDPPYSFRQIKEHYNKLGIPTSKLITSMAFYERTKSAACSKIKKGGYAISFGWNTNGFGKARGFRIVEIMSIAHGGSKNDTTVTVEIKI